MRVSKDFLEYENGMPQWIKISRNNENIWGYFQIVIKTWKGKKYEGYIEGDKDVLKLLDKYIPYNGKEKYQPPKQG